MLGYSIPAAELIPRPSTRAPSRAAQRLCCESSGLPRFLIPSDGVEDSEELSHAGDHGDHLGLAGGEQSLPEVANDGVVTHGRHGSDEESGADGAPATGDERLATPLP